MFLTKVFRFLDPKGPSLKTGIRVLGILTYIKFLNLDVALMFLYVYIFVALFAEKCFDFFKFVFGIACWLKKSNFLQGASWLT